MTEAYQASNIKKKNRTNNNVNSIVIGKWNLDFEKRRGTKIDSSENGAFTKKGLNFEISILTNEEIRNRFYGL